MNMLHDGFKGMSLTALLHIFHNQGLKLRSRNLAINQMVVRLLHVNQI